MADRASKPLRRPTGISCEVADDGWCLTISTRSLGEGLFYLGVCLILVAFSGFFFWHFLAMRSLPYLLIVFFPAPMLYLWGRHALMRLFGKVVVTCDGQQGTIFTGVGSFGRRQSFDWSRTTSVRDELAGGLIVLEGTTNVRFGHGLTKEQCGFVLKTLRQLLQKSEHRARPAIRDSEFRPTHPAILLDVTDHGWHLEVSLRSIIEGLLFLVISVILVVAAGSFFIHWLNDNNIRFLWRALPLLALLIPFPFFAVRRLFGKLVITVEHHHGTLCTGLGRFGRQHFDWSQITAIDDECYSRGKGMAWQLVLRGPRAVRFGHELTEPQRLEVLRLLRCLRQTQPGGESN